MPKKKADPDPPAAMEPRTTRRAASRAALQNMARLSASAYIDDEDDPDDPSETYDGLSDDDVPIETHHSAKKKKYSLSHRKSSDGNDRDVLVLKTIAAPDKNKVVAPALPVKEKEKTLMPPPSPQPDKPKQINWNEESLKLDAWAEDLSPAQLQRQNKINREIEEINARIEKLVKENGSELLYEGDSCVAYELTSITKTKTQPTTVTTTTTANRNNNMQLVMDPRSGVVVGTVAPQTVTIAQNQMNVQKAIVTTTVNTRKRGRQTMSPTPPAKVIKASSGVHTKVTESSSIGGIITSATTRPAVAAVVDLTAEDTTNNKPAADSREVSFNKLQGKTFPSLVVVARPHLRSKEASTTDRTKLDAKVKAVLMHVPTKFTEWLIQQGLIRSEQSCSSHPSNKLKLGMYSDVSKFPFSGGYVWISECCPQRFVSVFSGSLFEGSPHAPSVILKLIYHWSCQTNVQNVVQWVKVDNLYVKGLNTWLRAACSVALHTHIAPLGGPGCKVEVGVISLGTTSQDGHQRQVKVEVLGLLETEVKRIRLRAVEPLADGDRNYKKRFSKILEPLLQWVHPDSIIVTDLTVDKSTLHSMGFKNVQQSTSSDATVSNQTIMEYLRRIVPRMFQNTLSLLSRQIIQQFLDELVWREWFGVTAAQAFDNMVLHLSEQTRTETGQSLIMRLNKVAANPFKNWSIKIYGGGMNSAKQTGQTPIHEGQKRNLGRPRKPLPPKAPSPTPEIRPLKPISPDVPKQMVPLENYYYGTIESEKKTETNLVLNMKCTMCRIQFTNNIKMMDHLFTHAQNGQHGVHQCHYCLTSCTTKDGLTNHIQSTHPPDTRFNDKYACLLCEITFDNSYLLGEHMSKEHSPSELPYLCGTCGYRCSSHKQAIDHFYLEHDGGGTIQCPYCLKSTVVCSGGRMVVQNINYFMQHINKHQKKGLAKKCNKCNLWFIQKDFNREHNKLHESVRYNPGLQSWPVPKANAIMVPKSEYDYHDMEEKELDLNNLVIDLPDSLNCKECSTSLNKPGHFPTLQSCPNSNCRYTTCCVTTMQNHIKNCKIEAEKLPTNTLPFTLHCVCSYSDNDGYKMAKHLAVCERKSAYPSSDAAKLATVKHSMLDVLGLVRRSEEPNLPLEAVSIPQSADKPALEIMEIDSDDDDAVIEVIPDTEKDAVKIDDSPKPVEDSDKIDVKESEEVTKGSENADAIKKGESVEKESAEKELVEKEAVEKELVEKDAAEKESVEKESVQKQSVKKKTVGKESVGKKSGRKKKSEKDLPEKESLDKEHSDKETSEKVSNEKDVENEPVGKEPGDKDPSEKKVSDSNEKDLEEKESSEKDLKESESSEKHLTEEEPIETEEPVAKENGTAAEKSENQSSLEESTENKSSDDGTSKEIDTDKVEESMEETANDENESDKESEKVNHENELNKENPIEKSIVESEAVEKDAVESALEMLENNAMEASKGSKVNSKEVEPSDFDSMDVDDVATQVKNLNDTVAEILENSINKEKALPMDVDNNLDELLIASVPMDTLVNNSESQNNVEMDL